MAQTTTCIRCSRQMVVITLLVNEQPRTLRSCSHCDIREWETMTGNTSLSGVLDDLSQAASGS